MYDSANSEAWGSKALGSSPTLMLPMRSSKTRHLTELVTSGQQGGQAQAALTGRHRLDITSMQLFRPTRRTVAHPMIMPVIPSTATVTRRWAAAWHRLDREEAIMPQHKAGSQHTARGTGGKCAGETAPRRPLRLGP